jgi:glycosyltransferase involved in cell wall biosynthesis
VKFAGGGDMALLNELARGDNSFEFHGQFEYTREIANLHRDIDVIFAVYDKSNSNCQLAMPTKFYESLVSGIPIMVSDATEVGEQVRLAGVGIAVDGADVAAIAAALADVEKDSSWYQSATSKLSENPVDGFYSRFETAIEKVISVEVSRNV